MSLGETVVELVDLPGTYSLSRRAARTSWSPSIWSWANKPANAGRTLCWPLSMPSNLEPQYLYLVTQVMELGIRRSSSRLNMVDVAERQGVRVADAVAAPG